MDGLDGVPWRRLECTSGAATDVPELIAQLASDDEEEAREAAEQLGYELGDDGTVRSAGPPAVPFLVRLAALGGARFRDAALAVLAALVPPPGEPDVATHAGRGYLAPDATSAPGGASEPAGASETAGQVRRELAAYGADLLALLGDEDPAVRAMAARVLAGLPEEASETVPVLRAAAEGEPDPKAQASMVLAVAALPGADAGWLTELATRAGSPLVRTAAAVGTGWALGGQVPAPAREALLDAARVVPAGVDDEFVWTTGYENRFLRSAAPDDHELALDLIRAGLTAPSAERRYSAVTGASEVMRTWRSAPERVVPALAAVVADADGPVRQHAIRSIALAGRATALAGDQLAALLADRRPSTDPDRWPAPRWSALYGLARMGDVRCAPALAETLAQYTDFPWLTESVAGMAGHADALLAALRSLLASYPTGGAPDDLGSYVDDALAGIAGWGDQLRRLAGELLYLASAPDWEAWPGALPRVLGWLGTDGAPAVPYLRRLVRHDEEEARSGAAVALWRIAGDDPAPVLREVLSDPEIGTALAADAARELGPSAAALAPDFAALLTSDDPWRRVRAAAGLWSVTRDAGAVLPVLLPEAGPDERGALAIEVLAEIGPAAHEVLPVLEPMAFSERRIPYCVGDECILRDERCQHLARTAITAIGGP